MQNFLSVTLLDNAIPWQYGFQDSGTSIHEGIISLHNYILFYLVIIGFGVLWVIGSVLLNFTGNKSQLVYKYSNHGTLIELIWTITPALILILIAFPSFKLLYIMDEVISPSITVKIIGHQWYWSYEYSDFIGDDGKKIDFDSYMLTEDDLEYGSLRILEVDNRLVVPVNTQIRFIINSSDVIHNFAVPALGLKVDCVPGRLNATSILIERNGTYYGMCSELCSVGHAFIPIVIQAVSPDDYISWISVMASE